MRLFVGYVVYKDGKIIKFIFIVSNLGKFNEVFLYLNGYFSKIFFHRNI